MRLTRLVPGVLAGGVPDRRDGVRAEARGAAAPKPPSNDDCLACHGDASAAGASGRSVAVLPDKFGASIHGLAGVACVDCHADLATSAEFPHAEKLAPATCVTCHEQAVALYDASVHAEARRAQAQSVAAACKDCHGSHEIKPAKDPDSPTHHLNLPATCGRCHGNAEIIRKGRIAIGDVVAQFQDSIHGQALAKSGLTVAPNCKDCHDAHDIRRRTDPASPVYRTAVPATCGKCHEGVERRYQAGVHGDALAKGRPDAPVCVTCHSAHQIARTEGACVEGPGARRVRLVPPRVDEAPTATPSTARRRSSASCASRRAPTATARTTSSRSATPARPSRRRASWRRAARATRARTRASRSTTRTPTGTTARATRCSSTPRSSWRRCSIGVFSFFGIHTALWASRAVKPAVELAARPAAEE